MERFHYFTATYWLSGVLLVAALAIGALLYRTWRRRGAAPSALALPGAVAALVGLGGLIPPLVVKLGLLEDPLPWAWGLAGLALGGLFVMLIVVITTGRWLAILAYALAAFALLGLGAANV